MIKPIIIEENIDPTEWDKQLAYLKDKTGLSINNCINYKENSGLMQILRDSSTAINIILIDTEAEIVEDDWYLHHGFNESFSRQIEPEELKSVNASDQYKIIASTEGLEKVPTLSAQSIQLLINYYNEHKCMTESVEVETEKGFLHCKHCGAPYPYEANDGKCATCRKSGLGVMSKSTITLNQQGEVDIITHEEKLYTEEEMCSNMQQYLDEYVFTNETYVTPQKWFNSKKK